MSAQFLATNAAQKLSVTLRYTDADGKTCGEERALSTGGKSAEKPFRLHKVVRVPSKAVRCEIVTKGGAGLIGWLNDGEIRKICGLDGMARLVITLGYPKEGDTLRPKKRKDMEALVGYAD